MVAEFVLSSYESCCSSNLTSTYARRHVRNSHPVILLSVEVLKLGVTNEFRVVSLNVNGVGQTSHEQADGVSGVPTR